MTESSRTIVRPAHEYRRNPPTIFNLYGDQNFLAWAFSNLAETRIECPEEYYEIVRDCFVYEAAFIGTGSPVEWLEDTVVDYGIKYEILPTINRVIDGNHHLKNYLAVEGRHTVVLAKAGYTNYGHFVVEIAPKLCNLAKADLGPVNILIPHGMARFMPIVQLLCESLKIDALLSLYESAKLSSYSEVYYFGPVSRHARRKSKTLLECRALLQGIFGRADGEPTRDIYVKRSGSDGRQMPEWFDSFIVGHGFEIVEPAKLTFEEQAVVFSAARRVIGPLGAGVTNILYAKPGCEVMIIDPGLLDFFFWDLCSLVDGKFHWFFSGPVQNYSNDLALAPIDLSKSDIEPALRRLGWI